MKTLLEVLQAGTDYLARQGCDEARATMQHLLAHVLHCNRTALYSQFDRPVEEAELAPLRELLKRRAAGEPLQHLLGVTEFFRRDFLTDARALIPRPETEELVEMVLKKIPDHPVRILDMGTGSGVIGVTLALELKERAGEVVLADISPQALDLALDPAVRLILIDVMMPKLDGLSALLRIREKRNLPVIVLSAKSEDTDKILGLSMGADDYVTKPFNPQELAARVRSQLRRYTLLGDVHAEERQGLIVNGRLTYDPDRRELRADGEAVKLTATETKIVDLLMRNLGRNFPAEEIYRRVWDGEAAYACENTVMVHIRRIREKIELNPKEPDYIKVVWGIGYKMEQHGT